VTPPVTVPGDTNLSDAHVVSAYSLTFADTHCPYSWRDGQAELTWSHVIHI